MKKSSLATVRGGWIAAFVTTLMFSSLSAFAANVLILDDDYGTEVRDALTGAGHNVTSVAYFDWNGSNPSPAGFDVVILLKGYEYGYEIGDDAGSPAYAALLQFVQNGGVFASTEWHIYDMDGGIGLGLDPIAPFDYSTYEDYNYGGSYSVLIPGHPLAAGLPANWNAVSSNADGGSCADTRPGATVVLSRFMDYYDQDCMAAFGLAYIRVGQGVSIHLNSDLGHEDDYDATPELLQILRNIAAFSAARKPGGATAVPVSSAWVLLLLTAILGVVGARRARRH